MRATRWVVLGAAVLVTAVLGACSAGGPDEPAGAASGATDQQPARATPADDDGQDDAAACVAFGDVLTIVENADLAFAEGRMAAQEQLGWYRLATRVLDRLPSGGDSAVQAAIGALQTASPAVPAGTSVESTGVRSPAWDQAQGDLADACDEAGAPLAISVFTGG